MARLKPDQAAVAWVDFARRLEELGFVDSPKFKHLRQAIMAATSAGKQGCKVLTTNEHGLCKLTRVK